MGGDSRLAHTGPQGTDGRRPWLAGDGGGTVLDGRERRPASRRHRDGCRHADGADTGADSQRRSVRERAVGLGRLRTPRKPSPDGARTVTRRDASLALGGTMPIDTPRRRRGWLAWSAASLPIAPL